MPPFLGTNGLEIFEYLFQSEYAQNCIHYRCASSMNFVLIRSRIKHFIVAKTSNWSNILGKTRCWFLSDRMMMLSTIFYCQFWIFSDLYDSCQTYLPCVIPICYGPYAFTFSKFSSGIVHYERASINFSDMTLLDDLDHTE